MKSGLVFDDSQCRSATVMICRPARPPGSRRSCTVRKNAGQRHAGMDSIISIETTASNDPVVTSKSSSRTATRSRRRRSAAIRSTHAACSFDTVIVVTWHPISFAANAANPPHPDPISNTRIPGRRPVTSAIRRYFATCASSSVMPGRSNNAEEYVMVSSSQVWKNRFPRS